MASVVADKMERKTVTTVLEETNNVGIVQPRTSPRDVTHTLSHKFFGPKSPDTGPQRAKTNSMRSNKYSTLHVTMVMSWLHHFTGNRGLSLDH